MTRVLHLSDTHFGTELEPVVQAVQALVHEWQPEVVVLGGDITQRARRGQFAAARHFIQSLGRPVLAVPGNHDIPLFNIAARLFNPYGNYRRALGVALEPVFESDTLLAIGVNSARPLRRKNGAVSPAQIARVAQRLQQSRPEQLRLVFLHHPVQAIEQSDQSNLLIGRELAIPKWVDAGMDLILAGHIHLPYILPVCGRQGETGRQGWLVQAGTALSRRVRGGVPNSVNLISHYNKDGVHECSVQRWDYAASVGAFRPCHISTFNLNRTP